MSVLAWFSVARHAQLGPFDTQHSRLLLQLVAVDGRALERGEYWKLLASQFVHVHFLHMLFNAICICLLGSAIERANGHITAALVYLVGGTLGQYFSVVFSPEQVSSGASQALMALCGFALLRHVRGSMPRWAVVVGMPIVGLQVALDCHASGHIKPGHGFGFLAGCVLAVIVFRRRPEHDGGSRNVERRPHGNSS